MSNYILQNFIGFEVSRYLASNDIIACANTCKAFRQILQCPTCMNAPCHFITMNARSINKGSLYKDYHLGCQPAIIDIFLFFLPRARTCGDLRLDTELLINNYLGFTSIIDKTKVVMMFISSYPSVQRHGIFWLETMSLFVQYLRVRIEKHQMRSPNMRYVDIVNHCLRRPIDWAPIVALYDDDSELDGLDEDDYEDTASVNEDI